MCFAIVVSCMPSIRLFVLHFFPKLDKDPTRGGASSGPSAGGSISHPRSRGLPHASATKKSIRTMDTSLSGDNMSQYELLEVDFPAKAVNDKKIVGA